MPPSLLRKISVIFLLLLMPACAHQFPPEESRPGFGKVALVTLPGEGFKYDTPAQGRLSAAGVGLTQGLGASAEATAAAQDANVGIVILTLSPLFAIGGALYGAVDAEPQWRVNAFDEAVRQATENIDTRSLMREGILKEALAKNCSVVPYDEEIIYIDGKPDYRPLASKGIGTVIEARVLSCDLVGFGVHPEMQLIMETRVRVIKTADNAEVYLKNLKYWGGKIKFMDWAQDSSAITSQIEFATSVISETAVDQVFFAKAGRRALIHTRTLELGNAPVPR